MAEQKVAQEEARSPIDWPATFAGAAAAVTVAVLLSTLGAAGTLIGAALGSVVATVSTALYKQGIESSRRRMAEVQAVALQKVNLADQDLRRAERRPSGPRAEQDVARARERLDEASSALEPDTGPPAAEPPAAAEPGRWAALPWRRIALLAVAVFVLSLAVISIIEVLAGKSVSTITGGTDDDRTSITGIFGDRTAPDDEPTEQVTPTDSTQEPAESDSTTPTQETSPTTTDATEPTPSGTPTETVTVTETATESVDPVDPTASVTP
ncbi:hypothetical protein ACOACQ_21930 [Nocardioides sp. CPCC 206347]|uniref:hypothetical protein n=1 Tax=Nocardioides sp. CPCC 206347 TaxID=3406463 RepID=UPI003B429F0A